MSLKTFLIGTPLETHKEKHERLTKRAGLAIFSSDAMSSVAYATDEILLALVLGGAAMVHYSMPVAVAIATLILIVSISYFQTIHAYPSGGGSYIVAKANLGTYPGLTAGASLLIDYTLTVAVSISSGVMAITSAFPSLVPYRVSLCIGCIVVIVIGNLRGVRESAKIFAVPAYLFIGSMYILIGAALWRQFAGTEPPPPATLPATSEAAALAAAPVFLLMRAFASGCAALTGIEAVANGVQAFKPPESRNASITLLWMSTILGTIFIGVTFFANRYVDVSHLHNETVVSQLARGVFSTGPVYYVIQFSTALILVLAANTSYADFPRLSSVMARDGFLPRQLANRGDKLVFSNGILILTLFATMLVVLFKGDTHSLIPLYAVGVFLSFTLSQLGMVVHWVKDKGPGWQWRAIVNGIGTIATTVVLLDIGFSKFLDGAWIVILAIPAMIMLMVKCNVHYQAVARQLSLDFITSKPPYTHHKVIVPISGVHRAVLNAIRYGKILADDVSAIYININPAITDDIREKWKVYGLGIPLEIIDSPYRSLIEPLTDYIDAVRKEHPGGIITVLVPEFVPSRWWHHILHNQSALFLKGVLLFKKGVVMTSVPMHLKE